ncbi:MAG: hypothetical protein ORN54_12695 [Cyclobacteriaceae bacterium]|nr:hypothetical protein [Cyclobacteriaceae bacterium]
MKKIFKSFTLIINYKTFIITAMAVLSTFVCFRLGLTAKFPDMLVGVAIVFPVVFSIGSAYSRRETALQRYADFKGHAIAIYYATRDWTSSKDSALSLQMSQLVQDLMYQTKLMLKLTPDEFSKREKEMYGLFSKLSILSMRLRELGVQSGEISRVSQYVSKIIIAFDNMKIIHNYRTPVTLRTYSKVFIYVFPIIYGPYFSSTFNEYSAHLEYVMPVLYSFILVSLDNIQDHLENPFDEIGEDDIVIDADEVRNLMV